MAVLRRGQDRPAKGIRTVSCPYCWRETQAAWEAISIPCAHCNRRIELGDLMVTQNITRDVMTGGRVMVRPDCTVTGNIHASEIIVCGTVVGQLRAAGRVEVRRGAKVVGGIQARSLVMEEGCLLRGDLRIGVSREGA